MRYRFALLGMLLLLLAACGAPAVVEPTTASGGGPYPATDQPQSPTLPPTAPPESPYPGPGAQPTPTPEGAYPGGTIWVWRPFAEQQCGGEKTYADLDSAVAALEAAGIIVLGATTASVAVCEACDCPSSEHYRAHIPAADRAAAEALGWKER